MLYMQVCTFGFACMLRNARRVAVVAFPSARSQRSSAPAVSAPSLQKCSLQNGSNLFLSWARGHCYFNTCAISKRLFFKSLKRRLAPTSTDPFCHLQSNGKLLNKVFRSENDLYHSFFNAKPELLKLVDDVRLQILQGQDQVCPGVSKRSCRPRSPASSSNCLTFQTSNSVSARLGNFKCVSFLFLFSFQVGQPVCGQS